MSLVRDVERLVSGHLLVCPDETFESGHLRRIVINGYPYSAPEQGGGRERSIGMRANNFTRVDEPGAPPWRLGRAA